jgi:hypothetical protein
MEVQVQIDSVQNIIDSAYILSIVSEYVQELGYGIGYGSAWSPVPPGTIKVYASMDRHPFDPCDSNDPSTVYYCVADITVDQDRITIQSRKPVDVQLFSIYEPKSLDSVAKQLKMAADGLDAWNKLAFDRLGRNNGNHT